MSIEKLCKDSDTAYDEVLSDLKGLVDKYVSDPKGKKIMQAKLDQLLRLIDGDEGEE